MSAFKIKKNFFATFLAPWPQIRKLPPFKSFSPYVSFLAAFKTFSFVFSLQKFDYDMDFFAWIPFEVSSISWICRFRFFTNLGNFELLYLWIFFSFTFFPLSFWDSDDINVKFLATILQVCEPLFLFCLSFVSIYLLTDVPVR